MATKKKSNHQKVEEGLELLRSTLAPFLARELVANLAGDWWTKGVLAVLEGKGKKLPTSGTDPALVDQLDVGAVLQVFKNQWYIVGKKLSQDERSYVFELLGTRNKWAHQGAEDFTADDAHRALDTMARLAEHMDGKAAKALRQMAQEVEAWDIPEPLPFSGHAARAPHQVEPKDQTLLPWRDVITPNPEVAGGKYKQTEFAANLSDVLPGHDGPSEYTDAVEFFERTFLTQGMRQFLASCLERVTGKSGEPIVQLKTAFGGGKTHTLLALFHLLRGKVKAEQLSGIGDLLKEAKLSALPTAHFAILVGTDLSVEKPIRHKELDGLEARTLWGEMAIQLGGKKGFKLVEEADKQRVAPSSETLRDLLNAYSPSVVLMDELVAYARQLYGNEGLPAGSFDSLLTFVHNLTEAVGKAKNALLVVSIPESDIEIGGVGGKAALGAIEHTIGRMEAIWTPVAATEGFEIVRRRLFLRVRDSSAMDAVCRAYSQLYNQHTQDFPSSCREGTYLDRIRACYPIHPEVFDRLYEDWSTLEKFQRTRGVLRLMAATIHALWARQDKSLLIMPASVPLDVPKVRDEMTRYLTPDWNAIVDKDVDGPNSEPFQLDADNPRYGQIAAARRVTRTVFLGSAPSSKEQRARGIEDVRIRLGCIQPGEEISVFNDVLAKLTERLTHFYSAGGRYWFDTPPNLRRTVEDRAQALASHLVDEELERRVKEVRDKGIFRAVHPFLGSADIPDDMEARLVVLGPKHPHAKTDSEALKEAVRILEYRGSSSRQYRNMLLFVAPDRDNLSALQAEIRRFLAWDSVIKDARQLGLDLAQAEQAGDAKKRCDGTVVSRLEETFCWLIVPSQEGTNPIEWQVHKLPGSGANHVVKASKKAKGDGMVVDTWSPEILRMEMDKWLWQDTPHISVKQLWEYMAKYCYLSRLQDGGVLLNAIRDGLRSKDYFGYAAAVDEKGRYLGLFFGKAGAQVLVDGSSVLVKPKAAQAQLDEDARREEEMKAAGGGDEPKGGGEPRPGGSPPGGGELPQPQPAMPTRFFGSVRLSPTRLGREAASIAEEVIAHLQAQRDAEVEVTLEVHALIPDGASESLVRTVTENARTLKFESMGFEEE
ncbi:MAG: DUF499 domain-containing protein [Acidobacteriota bacterium]